MPLEITITAQDATNPDLILPDDITGDYNPSTNPNGWGAPNPARTDITVNNLDVTLPNTTTPVTIDVLAAPYVWMFTNTRLYFTPTIFNGSVVGTAITNATNATPIVITTSSVHGLSTGDSATVLNVLGNLAANGYWTITVLSTTSFSLDGSTGSGAYSSGGSVVYDATASSFQDGIYKFTANVTADNDDYTSTYYHLHIPLIKCCMDKYVAKIAGTNCNSSAWDKYAKMKLQYDMIINAWECGLYSDAQTAINRLTTICNDCGCGCGGGC